MQKKDIENIDDITVLVHEFYGNIRNNDLLGPIFNGIIKDQWPAHLSKMVQFWQTILLGENTYTGSPFPPHTKMPLTAVHFDTWIQLFEQTLTDNFEGAKADQALMRATQIAQVFSYKLSVLANQN